MSRLCFNFHAALGRLLLALALLTGAAAAQAQGYRIQPGDTLRIEVLEDETLNRAVLVSPDGRITVPLAGSVTAAGRTVEGVQEALTAQLAPSFAARPSVYVSLQQVAPQAELEPVEPVEPLLYDVYALGEVGSPGRLEVEPGTSLLQLFSEVGGFTPFAATRRIQLRRVVNGVETIYAIDYQAILDGRSPNGTASVLDGDVFVIPERRLFE